jgi:hypothetical protein
MVSTSWVSITPRNPSRRLQATATQKWWLVCVGVVVDTAWDGRPPPSVASFARSRCSSRNGALGWCRPLGGVRARCSHGAVKVQSVAHSKWRGRPRSFVYAYASRQRRQNVLQNPRTPAKMKCCVTSGLGYYPPVEGLFWILCAYIEVYT